MFVGGTFRIGFDRRTVPPRSGPALTLTRVTRTATASFDLGHGLDVGPGRTGRPALFMGGQDVGQLDRQAKLSGGTTAMVVVGVLLVVGIGAAVAISEANKCEEDCERVPPN